MTKRNKTDVTIGPKRVCPNTIRNLFYIDGIPFKFKIGDFPCLGKNFLDHKIIDDFDCIGNPWNRRTSNMKAGGNDKPFTLMNVKLIAMDLRYKGGYSYFGSLAGVLDIVVAVPGHIGHNGMNKFQDYLSCTLLFF